MKRSAAPRKRLSTEFERGPRRKFSCTREVAESEIPPVPERERNLPPLRRFPSAIPRTVQPTARVARGLMRKPFPCAEFTTRICTT